MLYFGDFETVKNPNAKLHIACSNPGNKRLSRSCASKQVHLSWLGKRETRASISTGTAVWANIWNWKTRSRKIQYLSISYLNISKYFSQLMSKSCICTSFDAASCCMMDSISCQQESLVTILRHTGPWRARWWCHCWWTLLQKRAMQSCRITLNSNKQEWMNSILYSSVQSASHDDTSCNQEGWLEQQKLSLLSCWQHHEKTRCSLDFARNNISKQYNILYCMKAATRQCHNQAG